MTVVEFSVNAGALAVIEGEIKERRRLVLCALEALAEKGRGSDTPVGAAENHAGVETVAAAGHARVPAGVAQRLIENAVAAADYRFGSQRISKSEARCKRLVVDALGVWFAETGGVARTRDVSGENQRV